MEVITVGPSREIKDLIIIADSELLRATRTKYTWIRATAPFNIHIPGVDTNVQHVIIANLGPQLY